ncbi:MAG: nuclear transport factor 2 family protein [Carbonactinosporaceae bacterium]
MEHPDVATVRRAYRAFTNGDMAALGTMIADDAVDHVPGSSQLAGDHRGKDAIFAYFAKLGQLTDGTLQVDLQQLMGDGHGHVVGVQRNTARRDGRRLDQMEAIVFTLREGKITDIREYEEDIDVANEFWR